jgi:hypothetical protein
LLTVLAAGSTGISIFSPLKLVIFESAFNSDPLDGTVPAFVGLTITALCVHGGSASVIRAGKVANHV